MELASSMEGVNCEITGSDNAVYMTQGFADNFSDLNSDFHLSDSE
jgi:thiamine biosynthesis lipoprotein